MKIVAGSSAEPASSAFHPAATWSSNATRKNVTPIAEYRRTVARFVTVKAR